ncbi:short-chain collagen C4-like [Mytilus californianus]|uniref:short-chain collagen C4-like n=1 Tax=Mytilus californianus TaxID=6549 RepID=UPI002246A166|nr:short-chain collagen C4-like [Mytilus californianus]
MRSKQFVSDALEAKMKALEVIVKSQIANFERNLTDQLTGYINEMVVKVDEENGKCSTYIRWGRSDCSGVNTEIVYSGYAAGEKYYWSSSYRGGASNMLCLPNNPELSDKEGSGASFIFGTEFEGNQFASDSSDNDVPCALCRSSNTTSSVMIPGRKTCYTGWKEEYNGILASTAHDHTPSPYICVDAHPTYVKGGQRSNNDHLLYVTVMKCGSLPCPPYKDNVQVYCVVCSK